MKTSIHGRNILNSTTRKAQGLRRGAWLFHTAWLFCDININIYINMKINDKYICILTYIRIYIHIYIYTHVYKGTYTYCWIASPANYYLNLMNCRGGSILYSERAPAPLSWHVSLDLGKSVQYSSNKLKKSHS